MMVLAVIGWILLGILGLLLLLLFLLCSLKLSLRAGYCETLLLKVGIGPVTLDLGSSLTAAKEAEEEAPAKKKKKKPAKKQTPKKEEKKKEISKKYTEKPALTAIITAFKDLVLGILGRFAKHLKLEMLRLRVLVASDDAAKTAMEYGAVCTAAGLVVTAAEALPSASNAIFWRTSPRSMRRSAFPSAFGGSYGWRCSPPSP